MREAQFWTWHVLAGVVILVLGGMHMITMHLDGLWGLFSPFGGSAIAWDNVAERSRQIIFPILYILLLGVALFHGFYGLRNILFELGCGKGVRSLINFVLVAGGLVLFAYGTWAAIAAHVV